MTSIKTRNILISICTVLIFLFVYTAINKLLDFRTFKTTLTRSPLVGNRADLLSWSLPVMELATACLLVFPRTHLTGLRLSLALMSLFTIYVAYMILFVPHLPCSCGGIISQLSWMQHLIVNIFFTLLALTGIILRTKPEFFIRINRTSRTPE